MFKKLASNAIKLGGSRATLFGKRFFADLASYNSCYKVIDKNYHHNNIFWDQIKDAVKQVEHADKNNSPITRQDLENIWDLKYSLSRTYDNPSYYEEFEPLYSTLNKADSMLTGSQSPKC